MRAVFWGIVFVLMVSLMAGCATGNKYDSKASDDTKLQYGGEFRWRIESSKGINQVHNQQ